MAEQIESEVIANVWKVLVKAGDAVASGDTLVILESMKMEIPVEVDNAGTVREVHVAEGDAVTEGAPLVTID